MKKNVRKTAFRSKKKRVLGEPSVLSREEYEGLDMDTKLELIQQLIPLGLMHVSELLQKEIISIAGERYKRYREPKECARYGSNPGSVRIAGQKVPFRIPRVRDRIKDCEVSLQTLQQLKDNGDLDELLLRRVLHGISCRDYEGAAASVPGAIGLSSSTTSRRMIMGTAKKLREFQERDLSHEDFVVLFIDGKTFAQDTLVVALGITIEGRKVPLGFVQTGTENKPVLSRFLKEMKERGLKTDQGLLIVIDGGKGIHAAVGEVFAERSLVQRCQWHKRENVVGYLPKTEQDDMRRRLQKAYERPTYSEAQEALIKILAELRETNLSAARSLEEGLDETLTLHKLGLFPLLGQSLKTTNCIESLFSQVENRCKKVSYWKNSSQKHRWMAACLLDMEGRLRRIKGYKHLLLLRERISNELGIKELKSVA